MSHMIKYTGMILMSLFAFAGVYFLKGVLTQSIPSHIPTNELLLKIPQVIFYRNFWLAIGCYMTALIVYLFLLHGNQVSKIFTTIVGVNVLLTNVGAFVFLGDSPDKYHLIGLCLILTGIFIINEI